MKYEEKFPLIDAFLTHRISDEENQELKSLRQIPEFEEEFLLRQEAREGAKLQGRLELKDRFRKLDQRPTGLRVVKSWWLVAAAVGLLLLAIPFLMKSPSSQDLYANYYSKMPNKIAPITRGDTDPDALKMGFIHYQRGDFNDALSVFKEELSSNADVEIYIGIIAMERGEFEKAISILQPISEVSDSRFQADAQWYLALAHLVSGNDVESLELLDILASGENAYTSRAEELRSELR